MTIPLAVEAFDLRDVFFFLFRNNVSPCGRDVIAATLSLSSVAPEISLLVVILLTSLPLVNGLLLTRHVSKEKVSKLILSKVLVFGWSVPLKAIGINFPDT